MIFPRAKRFQGNVAGRPGLSTVERKLVPSSSRASKGVKIDAATCGGSGVESESEQMFE